MAMTVSAREGARSKADADTPGWFDVGVDAASGHGQMPGFNYRTGAAQPVDAKACQGALRSDCRSTPVVANWKLFEAHSHHQLTNSKVLEQQHLSVTHNFQINRFDDNIWHF